MCVTNAANHQNTPIAQIKTSKVFLIRVKAKPRHFENFLEIFVVFWEKSPLIFAEKMGFTYMQKWKIMANF